LEILNSPKYVLYRHIRPDKDEVFYVGIGQLKRAYQFYKGRNKHWKNIFNINNKNIEIEILLEELTWEQACVKEIEFIQLYGRRDLGLGTLCNMTNGGEGAVGRKKSLETIQKFKQTMSKQPHPMKDKTHTPEARQKISESSRRPMHENTRKKLLEVNLTRTRTEKELKCLDRTGCVPTNAIKIINIETGRIFNSLREAAVEFGKHQQILKKYIENTEIENKTYQYYN